MLLLLAGTAGLGAYEYWQLPRVEYLRNSNPKTTAWMEMRAREAAEHKRPFHKRQLWRPYASFPEPLITSVLLAEDAAFFSHHGLDFDEIKEAVREDWDSKSFVRGASTITQQLAKNLFLSPSKNPIRKVEELLLTLRLEKALNKRRILELYLNVIEWGDGVFGAEAAAQAYFEKSSSALGFEESCVLAAMIPNPTRYSPFRKNRTLIYRYNLILEKLHAAGKLDDAALEAAKQTRVSLSDGTTFP